MSDVFEQLSILYIFLVAGWFIGKLKKRKGNALRHIIRIAC